MDKVNERDRSRSLGPALEKWYQFLRWLVPTVEKFPRSQKVTLGDRVQNTALEVLERLIEATYAREARPRRHLPLLSGRGPCSSQGRHAPAHCLPENAVVDRYDHRRLERSGDC
jgi:hypothetical protein